MEKFTICSSCGAKFNHDETNCPYCGTMNYEGAEKEYLEKLEDVRDDLEDLNEVPQEEVKKEFKKQAKLIRNVIIVAAVIGVMIFARGMIEDLLYKRDGKADFIWQSQNYPVMDALYAEGKYEELAEFYVNAQEEDKPVYNWEHAAFMRAYLLKEDYLFYLQEQKAGNMSAYRYTSAFYTQWSLHLMDVRMELTEEEAAYFAEVFEEAEYHLKNDWKLDEETYQKFYDDAMNHYGYVSYTDCEKYIKKWMKGEK